MSSNLTRQHRDRAPGEQQVGGVTLPLRDGATGQGDASLARDVPPDLEVYVPKCDVRQV